MSKPNIRAVFLLFFCLIYVDASKTTKVQTEKSKALLTNSTVKDVQGNAKTTSQNRSHDFYKLRPVVREKPPKMISHERVTQWASALSNELFSHEDKVVRRKEILKGFTNMKTEVRNGTSIIENIASVLEDLFQRRATAAEDIMRKVEILFEKKTNAPSTYRFYLSKGLNQIKKDPDKSEPGDISKPLNCSRLEPVHTDASKHFDAAVSLDTSSMHIAAEVFDCDDPVIDSIHYTEELLQTFRNNYAQDAMLDFQYFCSAQGFLRHYPAATWESMVKLNLQSPDTADVYDCRLRSWYVSASGAPRDVLILLDASGSMINSSKTVIAEIFISSLLNALTDDDRVNVLRFNVVIESPISCFENTLVSANHVNTAAMIEAIKEYKAINESKIELTLRKSVEFLQNQAKRSDPPPSCQQTIILITDSLYYNYTELMNQLDPEGNIRVFVMWLHDPRGLRDNTRELAKALSCSQDGYFAELLTNTDVTLQVMQILRVLERPLVSQRKKRLKVFSDIYAHIEDPRRAEYHWIEKENAEQAYRYNQLRKNKEKIINKTELYNYHLYQKSLDEYGHYYEGIDTDYRMMISVSVPVFENTEVENITIQLDEEKQRNSTRQYPVNRLLGVAGVDIPVDHIKLLIPYYEIGSGGSFFLIDHRGSIVIHDNFKPVLDGDILKPGYRTVDILDLEQSAEDYFPRNYPLHWRSFRQAMIIDHPKGTKQMHGKTIFDNGMRAALETKEYHWRRIINHYTAAIFLPTYGRERAVSDSEFTKALAEEALEALQTDFAIHPDWLYCRHVEPYFESRKKEFEHFLLRRSTDPQFRMQQLRHYFLPMPPTIMERTYKCDEKLVARVCYDAIATKQWAKEHELLGVRDCSACRLGSTTAFFATENGLTRWQLYHATSEDAPPPEGYEWPKGPSEPWYRRATASPGTLVVHAPAYPVQHMRNTAVPPKPLGARGKWLTAARTLNLPGKGEIGVAGFHFYPTHLDNMFDSITNFSCQEEDQEKCSARCDGKTWLCVLVDDAGWIVAGGTNPNEPNENGIRKHLATSHPGVLNALLKVKVFKLNWIHDYQAVCFAYEDDASSSASTIASFLISTFRTVSVLMRIAANTLCAIKLLWSVHLTQADTQKEIEKRRKRLKKDMARETYDSLFDKRVVVNRTKYSACDRYRPVYELQRSSLSKLARPAELCSWPFVAAPVNQTNLLLIAIYMNCPYEGIYPDPLVNKVATPKDDENADEDELPSSRLACWRNRVPLPGRLPHSTCYPHNYAKEEGYRQCGEWIPDPENGTSFRNPCNFLIFILILLFYL